MNESQEIVTTIRRTYHRRLLSPVLTGIILTVLLGFASLLATAGGHGTYVPVALFFPGALLLAIGLTVISNPVLFIAAVQWPLYGAIVGWAAARGRKKDAIVYLTVVHALLVATCFLFDRRGQFL